MKTHLKLNFLTYLALAALLAALPLAASAQGFGQPGFGGPRVFRGGDGPGPGFGGPRGGHVTWSGTVDETTIVSIHRGDINTRVAQGKDSNDVNSQITGRLPDRPVQVFLPDRQGRGRIQIVEQPNPGNDFTARVRLHDPQPGSGFYRFTLAWRPGDGY